MKMAETQVKKKRILVVDDDADLSELVRLRLESAGYEVCRSANGREAIQMFQEERPSAIILDMEMPEKNGYTTLLELKQKFDSEEKGEKRAPVPIIVITGLSGSVLHEMINTVGVYGFMQKPFSISLLVEKLKKALGEKNG